MKLNTYQIKISIALTLLAILLSQGLWIHNMYQTYRYESFRAIDGAATAAIMKEYSSRHEQMGGTIVSTPLTSHLDTARYISKYVQLQDTSFEVTFDRFDPYSEMKLNQFILKDHLQVDVDALDSIFKLELGARGFPHAESFIEYFNTATNDRISSSLIHPEIKGYQASEIKIIDIFGTLGVQAHAKIPVSSILIKMSFQLLLSLLLVLICIFLLFAVIKTFFWKETLDSMRHESISTMTHEFKRPISSSVAQVALIPYYLKKNDLEKVNKYAEDILLELNKLSSYTDRIQRISNDVNVNLHLSFSSVSLLDFVDLIRKKYVDDAERKFDLEMNLKSTRDSVNMDILHMTNVIDNLIENAIKYSDNQLEIVLNIKDRNNGISISVEDNGIGISSSELKKIFNKYFRSSSVIGKNTTGFGLGLTYCKLVVEGHGGTIEVESELDHGSKFTIFLPVD